MGKTVEIGYLREPVEIIDAPQPGRHGRTGRIRHVNGENVAIDHATLQALTERARHARERSVSPAVVEGCLWA